MQATAWCHPEIAARHQYKNTKHKKKQILQSQGQANI